jgi:DNA-binding transcriptional LysR family regulator
MASLDDLALFVGIVDAGSLAAAARAAELPKSTVSRRLMAMEDRLNVRLLQRSTRKLSLTDAGRQLYERCRPLVSEAQAAEEELLAQPGEPHGLLRLTASGAFGRLFVAPLLGEFLARYPRVRGELLLLDRSVNLIEEGFDLAIRMGKLQDSGLIARKLADIERMLCAAPRYLARAGGIARLEDLAQHDRLTTVTGNSWTFEASPRALAALGPGRMVSNHLEVLHAAALQGCGIAMLPRFMVLDDLAAGRLVSVLPNTPPTAGAAHVLWPTQRGVPTRARSFVDFMVERLSRAEVWDRPLLGRLEMDGEPLI